ncbi:hypothetical protein HYPSUDRAFT_207128 [Hypholoma sublateritium FD-334 SS-4]|uniref:DNA 3'-5' helicase n=1 Tax=Hypholoma sublateritium (strain FD-334 SS-4) TaxID=945553 RepID=A0A0D2KP01_HYPSF|nr:hypothetical protein HYPSUDRAFT_207128 [Hypholoma sublateritium FD-334 SS-4]
MRLDGSFRVASDITAICAALEYCIRGTMLVKITSKSKEENISIFKVLDEVTKYLTTKEETPMAFVYNVHRVLKSIRTDEVTRAKHHFPGASPRVIDCDGHLVRLSDIKEMHDKEHLWPGLKGTMSAEKFGVRCGDMTERYMRQQFRPLAWRSLISAFGKRLPSSRAFEANEDLFCDLAMMHSSSMASKRYGRLSEEAQHGDYRTTIGCVQAGLDFQKHIGIGQSRPFILESSSDDQPVSVSTGAVLDDTMMERIARSVLHGISDTLESRIKETVLDSMADVMARVLPQVPRPLDDNNLRLCSDISPHPSRLRSLREFLGRPNAKFTCPEQALLFELMCRGEQNVLGVLGTGKGKTLLVLLYAYTFRSQGITVVVLPLSPLRDEYLRRARELRVLASIWQRTKSYNPDVSLLCVSVEDTGCDDFKKYLAKLEHAGRLNCIVYDEVHKLMTDKDFRDAFDNFWVLNTVKAVKFAFSGSIPPSTLALFSQLTKTTWRIVRTPSNRPELAYKIIHVKSNVCEKIATDVNSIMSDYESKSDDRLMVFCRSHKEVDILSKALGVQGFTSQTVDTNSHTMESWRAGKPKCIISTSILGCGFDYSAVRHVMHWGPAYTMIDHYQQESRAGRDGKRAEAITYIEEPYRPTKCTPDDLFGAGDLNKWAVATNQCLRIIPSSYLDGVPITCSLLPDCELCSYCDEQTYQSPPRQAVYLAPYVRDAVKSVSRGMAPPQTPLPVVDSRALSFHFPTPRSSDSYRIPPAPSARFRSSSVYSMPIAEPNDDVFMTPSSHSNVSMNLSDLNFSSPTIYESASSPDIFSTTLDDNPPAKRQLASSMATQNKRVCLLDPISGRPALHSSTPLPVQAPARPGVVARANTIAVNNNVNGLKSAINRTRQAFEKLRTSCVICLLLGDEDWETHKYDNCVGLPMQFAKDDMFTKFKKEFKYLRGCYGCGIEAVHPTGSYGKSCPDDGHMIRVLYAYSWGGYSIFRDYPGRPVDLLAPPDHDLSTDERAPILKRVSQHFYSDGSGYPELYNIFLYAMRMRGVIQ